MGWFEALGFKPRQLGSGTASATVRRIAAELDALDADRARYLAGFAYLLGRVAHADHDIGGEETAAMEGLLQRVGHLPEDQAVLVVQIAKAQNELFGGTENFLVSRELKRVVRPEELRALLDALFAVAAADGAISGEEESQIRQIASELGLSHGDLVASRAAWSAHRSVLRSLRGDDPSSG
ncbi:MAG TPA: TerB family tellurite resistance protein [Thermoanaerobaculia bacterium]|nr:TerB family tellurite resistance protein [Thermoanaerobaculia bacterium]